MPRRSYESEKADEHIQAAATSDTDVNTEPHVVKVVANTQADTGSTTTSPTGTPINKLAEMARTLRISDVVAFPPKGALEQIREQHLTEKEFRNERRAREDKFFEALKLLLENNLGEPDLDSAVRRPITSGIFRTRADVYFRNVSVEICFLDPTMPLRFFGFELMESMEHLLMVDRMQGKHFRKTVLFCTHEARAEMPKLIEHTRNYVDSARGLEINVAFATGPADAARQIADLITKTNADKV